MKAENASIESFAALKTELTGPKANIFMSSPRKDNKHEPSVQDGKNKDINDDDFSYPSL